MMTREEYERRKRRLEEQLAEGIELLRAGFRQQIRALELVWITTAAEDVTLASIPATVTSRGEPSGSVTTAAPPHRAKPSRRPRQKAGKLWEDVDAIFDDLPQVFDRNDVVRALGYEPERSSLHRVMRSFRLAGDIVIKVLSAGRTPVKYEKVEEDAGTAVAASDEAEEARLPAS